MELEGATERQYLEIDMVSNLELKGPPTVVYVAFLSALCDPQIFSHLSYSVFSLFDLSRAKECSLTNL
jgi:hypothetical protein